MEYYKIIYSNQLIGVVSTKNFIAYNIAAQCFFRSNKELGEYISYDGKLYRDSWMHPTQITRDFLTAKILPISAEEYQIYAQAEEFNVIDDVEEEPKEPEPLPEDPNDIISLEFIRTSKLNEMSHTCNQVIESGFDLQLSDGNTHHFSLTTQDQINLISLGSMAANGMEEIPYHADGETCIFYTAEEINHIVTAATNYKIYHTTYYNALKNYINHLDTIEQIAAVTYGMELPEEYQTDVLKRLINENN